MENPNYEFEQSRELPMMALRGLTVFPGMLLNFDVERPMSIASLNQAMGEDQVIFLAAQKEMATDVPTPDDVYAVGTVCRIKQMMKQPGNKTIRVMVEGLVRGQVAAVTSTSPGFMAVIDPLPDAEERSTARVEALIRHCCNLFDDYVHASGNLAPEAIINILGSTNATFVANFIAQHVYLRPEEKQELLEKLRALAEFHEGSFSQMGEYPAWEYRKDSPLRDIMVRIYREMFGKEPQVLAIHAGLECGLLGEKLPGLDCVSIGPQMHDIHTSREKLDIASTERTWRFLLAVLKAL